MLSDEPVQYGVGDWPEGERGNHRARVRVEAAADAVVARIPWRRRDARPEKKNVVVVDAATGEAIGNVARLEVAREAGVIAFQPRTVPGECHVYYMPCKIVGAWYHPSTEYEQPKDTADAKWLERNGLSGDALKAGK